MRRSKRRAPPTTIALCDETQARAKLAEVLGGAQQQACDDDDDVGFGDPLLNGDDRRRATALQRLLNDPMRRLIIADRRMKMDLDRLKAEMPHFGPTIDILLGKIAISLRAGCGLAWPPLLLVSEPGLGKSHFARRIAKILGTRAEFISGANAIDLKMNIGGLGPAWKGAREGQVARALIASETASPIIVLDELDKVSASARGGDPTDCLLALLEPESAQAFVDEFLEVPIRADRIFWLLAANDITSLTAPLLDRVFVVEINRPDRDATRRLAATIFADLNKGAGYPLKPALTSDVLDQLETETPRAIRKILDIAIGLAVRAGRNKMTVGDMKETKTLTEQFDLSRNGRVGFIQTFKNHGIAKPLACNNVIGPTFEVD